MKPFINPVMPQLRFQLKHIGLAFIVAIFAGSASAFFLFALDWATTTRENHHWLIAFLPVAGFIVAWIYLHHGSAVEAGNNLLIDEIHEPKNVIPLRMAPLVLAATVISHLFGASVGREGTAVQMGGSLADQLTHIFKLHSRDRRLLLMAGISAGFASVFGTPLAGAVFGLEVLVIGRLGLRENMYAVLPCLLAAFVADKVGLLWGVHHTHYAIASLPPASVWIFSAMVIAGVIFGVTGRIFVGATHGLGAMLKKAIPYAPLRALSGGAVIAMIVLGADILYGSNSILHRYIGLGIPVIAESFQQALSPADFVGKMVFTITSLASGFKGGEVTPLFYIGATLGNVIAPYFHLAAPFLAGIGFVAVFAGAANVPLASTIMAMELFGMDIGMYAALACVLSYTCSGHTGIYHAQRRPMHRRVTNDTNPDQPN